MPLLFTHLTNLSFNSLDTGVEYEAPEDALALGVHSAVMIAADEIRHAERTAAVEVCIKQADGTALLRSIVTIAVAPLMAKVSRPEPDAS